MAADSELPERPVTAGDLDVNESDDGLVVLDKATGRVHYLNNTAAVIFALCDGSNDLPTITKEVASLFGLDDDPESEVRTSLAQLAAEGLIAS